VTKVTLTKVATEEVRITSEGSEYEVSVLFGPGKLGTFLRFGRAGDIVLSTDCWIEGHLRTGVGGLNLGISAREGKRLVVSADPEKNRIMIVEEGAP